METLKKVITIGMFMMMAVSFSKLAHAGATGYRMRPHNHSVERWAKRIQKGHAVKITKFAKIVKK